MRVGFGDGRQDTLARMASCQGEDTLNEANGTDTPRSERRVGPLLDRRADALTLPDDPIDKGLLTARGFGFAGARRKHAGRDPPYLQWPVFRRSVVGKRPKRSCFVSGV